MLLFCSKYAHGINPPNGVVWKYSSCKLMYKFILQLLLLKSVTEY